MNQEEFTIGESDFNLNFKKSHVNGCMDWGDLNPKAMLKLVEMKFDGISNCMWQKTHLG